MKKKNKKALGIIARIVAFIVKTIIEKKRKK